jgi:hypothetical protein
MEWSTPFPDERMAGKTWPHFAGVLPYSIRPRDESPLFGEIVFLLGREHENQGWSGSLRWSDFGGKPDPRYDATILDAASREAYEESMGLLGSQEDIKNAIATNGTLIKSDDGKVCSYLLPIAYDETLPKRYSDVYRSMLRCAVPHARKKGHIHVPGCASGEGLFEKTAVAWVEAKKLLIADCDPNSPHVQWIEKELRRDFNRSLKTFLTKTFRPLIPRPSSRLICQARSPFEQAMP